MYIVTKLLLNPYSLLPYLIFLYFLNYKGNRVPSLGSFGFSYLLLFVLATIPSGIGEGFESEDPGAKKTSDVLRRHRQAPLRSSLSLSKSLTLLTLLTPF